MTSKTETQIAEENIKKYKVLENYPFNPTKKIIEEQRIHRSLVRVFGESHKTSSQRFLEFLEQLRIDKVWDVCWLQEDGVNIKDKLVDLKQAIKLYKKAGI